MFIELRSRLVQFDTSRTIAERRNSTYNHLCFLQPCRRARPSWARFGERALHVRAAAAASVYKLPGELRRRWSEALLSVAKAEAQHTPTTFNSIVASLSYVPGSGSSAYAAV